MGYQGQGTTAQRCRGRSGMQQLSRETVHLRATRAERLRKLVCCWALRARTVYQCTVGGRATCVMPKVTLKRAVAQASGQGAPTPPQPPHARMPCAQADPCFHAAAVT